MDQADLATRVAELEREFDAMRLRCDIFENFCMSAIGLLAEEDDRDALRVMIALQVSRMRGSDDIAVTNALQGLLRAIDRDFPGPQS